jgi:hypothetical protein
MLNRHMLVGPTKKGYFMFEECGNVTHPTLGLVVGETYTFVQHDRSNWMHPLGFGYASDDDDVEGALLTPTTTHTSSTCVQNSSCPHPMYYLNDVFLGNTSVDSNDFGLDLTTESYEPYFKRAITDWIELGNFTVKLLFDDTNYDQDLFYFCHVRK